MRAERAQRKHTRYLAPALDAPNSAHHELWQTHAKNMKGKYPYKKMLKYPHLAPQDKIIWERFIDDNPDYFTSVDYDVKVGEGQTIKAKPHAMTAEEWRKHTQKRIDVVGYKDNTIYIIELKPSASFSAIGQAVSYALLYRQEFKPSGEILPTIITDREVLDIRNLCNQQGILYLTA